MINYSVATAGFQGAQRTCQALQKTLPARIHSCSLEDAGGTCPRKRAGHQDILQVLELEAESAHTFLGATMAHPFIHQESNKPNTHP